MRRYPGADGLRGLAILLVVCHHYGLLPYLGGVDLFFVLSGFLLGGILVEKRGTQGCYRTFYARRVCRLFPLYYLFLAVYFGAAALSARDWVPEPEWLEPWLFEGSFPPWVYALFAQNIAAALSGTRGAEGIGPAWSLAVEEQFVLLLAPLVALCPPRRLAVMMVGVAVGAPLFRLLCYLAGWKLAPFVLLPARADAFALGILVALVARHTLPRKSLTFPILAVAAFGAAFVLVFPALVPRFAETMLLDSALSTFWAATLAASLVATSWGAALLRPLAPLGIVAYGAFLFHIPVHALVCWVLFTEPVASVWFPLTGTWAERGPVFVALPVTFLLGWLSWRFFESRFVFWGRKRFRYEPTGAAKGDKERITSERPANRPASSPGVI